MVRELADVNVRPLLIIIVRSWKLEEVPEAYKNARITLVFKDKKEWSKVTLPICSALMRHILECWVLFWFPQ